MKKIKCDLCEGLIVNGRCVQCGMYYWQNRGRYYLNERRPIDSSKESYDVTSYETAADSDYENMRKKQEQQRQIQQKREQQRKIQRSQTQQKQTQQQRSKTQQRQENTKQRKSTETAYSWANSSSRQRSETIRTAQNSGSHSGKKNSKAGAIVSVVFLAIALLGQVLENMEFYTTKVKEWVSPEPEITIEEEYVEYEDIYEYVTRQIPENGEEYEAILTSGHYTVGQHIPEGIYTISMDANRPMTISGSYVYLEDIENYIYESWWFEEQEVWDGYYTVEDVRLYDGAVIEVMTYGEVILNTSNGQVENMQESTTNPLVDSIVLNEEIAIVGEDVPAGVYDAILVSGAGEMMITSVDDYTYWHHFVAEEDYASIGFNNIELGEGDQIELISYGEEEYCLILSPSPEIFE